MTERFIHSLDTLLLPPYLLYASRASPVHSYGGGSAPQRRLLICRHTTPPSIFTLRDFVAAFAGLFLRRGFRPPTTVAYLSTNLRRLSLLSATSSPLSPVHSYGAYATFPFYTLDSFITRDFTSSLREISLHCYSDSNSLL